MLRILSGGRRGIGTNEERDQTLNQLLTELDGFEGRPGVLLLAATNRPEVRHACRACSRQTMSRACNASKLIYRLLPGYGSPVEVWGVHCVACSQITQEDTPSQLPAI